MNFRRSIIISEAWRPEVARRGNIFLRFLEKKNIYGNIFKILFQKNSWSHWWTCCVQISRNLVDEKSVKSCVACLTKTKFRLPVQLSLLHGSRPNLWGPAPENILIVLQISSKSVHFRRSYIRAHEHRPTVLESESDIRLKPSFEPNNQGQNRNTIGVTPLQSLWIVQSLFNKLKK